MVFIFRDLFKFACFLQDNATNKISLVDNPERVKELVENFKKIIEEHDGIYPVKNKEGRFECFQ